MSKSNIKHLQQQLVEIDLFRRKLASLAGVSHSGDRDVWAECGYPEETQLTNAAILERYKMGDIAGTINDAFPDATWAVDPVIYEEAGDEDTKFESAIKRIANQTRLWSNVAAADRLAGLGRYAVLFLGFGDGDLQNEASKASDLLFVTAYSEDKAKVAEWDTDKTSRRFGLPIAYQINMASSFGSTAVTGTQSTLVHFSRVLHICESRSGDRVYHEPRLKGVWHRLMDLDKLLGGGAEMFWKGAWPGTIYNLDKDAPALTDAQVANMEKEIQAYHHSLRRYMQLQGIDVRQLSPNVKDPGANIEEQLKFISARTRIPIRILTGSERGELASSQDATEWDDRVRERREQFAEPVVVRVLVDRLVKLGVLEPPKKENEYTVSWERDRQVSDTEKANLGKLRTDCLAAYVGGGLQDLIPPFAYFTTFMGMEDDEAQALVDEMEKQAAESAKQAEEDAKAAAEQAAAAPAAGGEEQPAPVPSAPVKTPSPGEQTPATKAPPKALGGEGSGNFC